MKRERFEFETVALENGITVMTKEADTPFALARMLFPFGSAHNAPALDGGAHFLEHMIGHRSKREPAKDAFVGKLEKQGGNTNAFTSSRRTMFVLDAPTQVFDGNFASWLDHIFEPIFDANDVELERSIIRNERKRSERWYPADNEIDSWLSTEWRSSMRMPLTQVFGSDESLAALNPNSLAELHGAYFSRGSTVLLGGTFDRNAALEALSRIPTRPEEKRPLRYAEISWKNRNYSERRFRDASRHIYVRGGIFARPSYQDYLLCWTICDILANTTQGALYDWLRKEKGWVYNLGWSVGRNDIDGSWDMWFPLNDKGEVEAVRAEADARAMAALRDEQLVASEIERVKANRVFWYQTLGEVLDAAADHIEADGTIRTEAETLAILDSCKDVSTLLEFYKKHMSGDALGEFLALPED